MWSLSLYDEELKKQQDEKNQQAQEELDDNIGKLRKKRGDNHITQEECSETQYIQFSKMETMYVST